MKRRATRSLGLAIANQSEMHAAEGMKYICSALMILLILSVISVMSAAAQSAEQEPSAQPQTNPGNSRQGRSGREEVGPSADSIRPYRPSGRDPFKKAVKQPKKVEKKEGPRLIPPPPLETRRAEFRQKVEMARARDLPDPNPLTQYLINELSVTGIFSDEQGNGAFVKAQPTGTMFFVRRGTPCYNGEVLRIETDESDNGAKVLFREVSYIEINGKRSPQERVVGKIPGAPEK
ncbi:MAG: hypothetical protein L0229_25785 [Blastocatellia bacterium]|nr:hypothetical protein [Blastocatellia bacterium]